MTTRMRRALLALLAGTLMAMAAQAQAPTPPGGLAWQLSTLAQVPDGRIGVAATDLATGETIAFAGRDPFPMASTVKVAIAATYLAAVDRGRFDLEQLYRYGRAVPTARQLIERMLIRSDNGAADILLRAVGGPEAVNAWLSHAGIHGQRMDRTIARLVADDRGPVRARADWPRGPEEVAQSASLGADGEVDPAFVGDARDTSTPNAMIALLAKLHGGTLLSPNSTHVLFDTMARCVTGPHRLKGGVPAGTAVAHKTGTLAGVSDDVGIVSLPNGHALAIAVFARGMRSEGARDRTIADVSRLLFDGFSGFGGGTMGLATAR